MILQQNVIGKYRLELFYRRPQTLPEFIFIYLYFAAKKTSHFYNITIVLFLSPHICFVLLRPSSSAPFASADVRRRKLGPQPLQPQSLQPLGTGATFNQPDTYPDQRYWTAWGNRLFALRCPQPRPKNGEYFDAGSGSTIIESVAH